MNNKGILTTALCLSVMTIDDGTEYHGKSSGHQG